MAAAICRCGARKYPDQAAASAVERSGADKCPNCRAFALDHTWRGDFRDDDNPRCLDCDVRYGSHGGPR